MSNTNFCESDVKENRMNDEDVPPRRCFLYHYQGSDCHPVTSKMKWSEQVNDLMMECCYQGGPARGYRKRLHPDWKKEVCLSVSNKKYVTNKTHYYESMIRGNQEKSL